MSSLSFHLLAEVNGPAEADYSKILMLNSCVALGCTNIELEVALAFTIFHVLKRHNNCGLLHLDLLSHRILKHALMRSDNSLVEDYQFNYKLESELLGSN